MNIYVANLSFKTTGESLQKLFENYGEVTSVNIITDRETGRSRGFGFIDMTNDEEGQKAIDGLNETSVDGKEIIVNIARPKTERSNGNYSNRNGGSQGGFNRRRF